jgi:hypothetical protein
MDWTRCTLLIKLPQIHTDSFGTQQDPCGEYTPRVTSRHMTNDNTIDSTGPDLVGKPIQKHKFSPWSLPQAYFAISGGIAVDCSTFGMRQRLMFTPFGIVELARLGILPEVNAEEIHDRSKADSIAKIFVCAQFLYFVIQVIARAVSGLPITLLELHMLTHIICAILLYVIWFNKPYDVRSPHLCRDQRVIDLAMFFILRGSEVRWGRVQAAQKHSIEMKHIVRAGKVRGEDPRRIDHLRAAKRAVQFLEIHGSTLSWGIHDATNTICFQHQYVTSWSSDYEMIGSICDNVQPERGGKKNLLNSRIICALGVLYGTSHLLT